MSQTHSVSEDGLRAPSPSGDKRRNKLGYQRTSVACGHCRRRKIRCLLPSPEDPLGRCANCIRLKKECTFFPVDHTPDGTRRNTASSSTDSPSAPLTPSQLSDGQQQSSDYDLATGTDPYGNLPYPSSRSLSTPYGSSSAPSNLPIHANYTVPAVSEHDQWPIGLVPSQQSHLAAAGDQRSPYWHSESSTPNTTNFSHGAGYEASPLSSYPNPEQHSQQPWLGGRSLSYSHLEGLQNQQPFHGNYTSLSPQMQDGISPFGHPTANSPSSLNHGRDTGQHGLSSSYQMPNSYSPFSTPWLSPNQGDTGSSTQQWFAEPNSLIPSQSHEHLNDQYVDGSPYPPATTHP